MTQILFYWVPEPDEENPTAYHSKGHGYELHVYEDTEFAAWSWIVRDLETGGLTDSGMTRHDDEAVKAAERAVRYKLLGVKNNGLY